MYKVAFKTKNNIKREFESMERAINYVLYLERKYPTENIFILDENGDDIANNIEY